MTARESYRRISEERIPYFKQYTHDKPMVMSLDTYLNTKRLGAILNKAIRYLAGHYDEWQDIFPVGKRGLEILNIAGNYAFRPGTYRTDFVITPEEDLKIIEMTTRFPLNGYLDSGFFSEIGSEMAGKSGLRGVIDAYSPFLDYLFGDFIPTRKIRVVKGGDRMCDFRIYSRLFADSADFDVIGAHEVKLRESELKDATVIEELNLNEICSMDDESIDILCKNNVFNDLRNLFLVHDKRFFVMLSDDDFLGRFLDDDEKSLLSGYVVPSYVKTVNPDIFEKAHREKDDWILKPFNLGKSVGVVAGCMADGAYWDSLFEGGAIDGYVLQPMIPQCRFSGYVGNELRNDYVTGTLLYMDDKYYGPGLYRASSCIVTNQGDDRKLAFVIADEKKGSDGINVI